MLSQAQKQVSRKVLGTDAASEVAQTAESTKKLHTSAAASAIGTLVRFLHACMRHTASWWVLTSAPMAGWGAMLCCRPPATMPPYQEGGVCRCLLHHPRHLASCINRLCESHPWDL